MVIDSQSAPEAVYWQSSGNPCFLIPMDNGLYDQKVSFTHATPNYYTVKYVYGVPYIYISPADTTSRAIFYNYVPELEPMTEYTTGTASCTTATTAVTGSSTQWAGYIDTNLEYYLRFDGDGTGSESKWYKINTTSGLAAATITLSDTYGGATKSSAAYTISMVSRWPTRYDSPMIYGAALRIDPEATGAQRWASHYASALNLQLSADGRAIQGTHGAYKRRPNV